MARPKPPIERVQISLKVSPQFLRLIDARRGKESRAAWLEGLALMGAYRDVSTAPKAAASALRDAHNKRQRESAPRVALLRRLNQSEADAMPGPISQSNPGPRDTDPYVPAWCYPKGPRMCPCGHHEGYHADDGRCTLERWMATCTCSGLPADCLTPREEIL